LFRGELLKGFDIASEIWCDWLDSERRRLHDLAAIVLFGISKLYSKAGAHAAAIGAARRFLAIEPYRQVGHRQLMRALAAAE
jgi:DNA-binding SARP family transcriptional activator